MTYYITSVLDRGLLLAEATIKLVIRSIFLSLDVLFSIVGVNTEAIWDMIVGLLDSDINVWLDKEFAAKL